VEPCIGVFSINMPIWNFYVFGIGPRSEELKENQSQIDSSFKE
jgi:hypothetical protein